MKKITVFILALAIAASALILTACGKTQQTTTSTTEAEVIVPVKKTAYDIFSDAYGKTKALSAVEYNCKMDVSMVNGEEEIGIDVKTHAKTVGINDKKPVSSGVVDLSIGGVTVSASVYNADGMAYIDIAKLSKKKIAIDSPEAITYNLSSMTKKSIVAFPEEILKDVNIVENDDGTKTIAFELTSEQFKSSYKEALESFLKFIEEDDYSSLSEMSFRGVNVNVCIGSDGYISKYSLDYTLVKDEASKTEEDEDIELNASIEIEFVNPGAEVKVDVPADIDSYFSAADAYKAYLNAFRKTRSLSAVEYAMLSKATATSYLGVSVLTEVSSGAKISGFDTGKPIASGYVESKGSLSSGRVSVYNENGYAYVTVAGVGNGKFDIEVEPIAAYNLVSPFKELLVELPKKAFDDVEVETVLGKTKITGIVLDQKEFLRCFRSVADTLSEYEEYNYGYEISNALISVTIDSDGIICEHSVSYDLVLKNADGTTLSSSAAQVDTKILNTGAKVKVDVPGNLDDYKLENEAYYLLMRALMKTEDRDSYKYYMINNAKYEFDGVKSELNVRFGGDVKGLIGGVIIGSGEIKIEENGKTSEASVYRKDKTEYLNAGGQKTRYNISDESDSYLLLPSIDDIRNMLPKELFEKAEVITFDSGSMQININLGEFDFGEVYGSDIEELEQVVRERYGKTILGSAKEYHYMVPTISFGIDENGYFTEYWTSFHIGLEFSLVGGNKTLITKKCLDQVGIWSPEVGAYIEVPTDLSSYVASN